ncbi:MAG: glycoside hydrolase [Fimbriimonas sp.]
MSLSRYLLPALAILSATSFAQVDPSLYDAMRWRCIGPHRGGRTVGATGIPGKPNVFYIGVNNGGVWKTNDYGRVWKPIFDDQPTGSIGALAVAPSRPDTIYVGCGEGLQRPDLSVGDGMYKSTDGGKTWTHLGLRDGQQIGSIIVDPRNPDRLFVAVLGHPYGPNPERGVFRSLDGGKNFEKVLYKDENTGAIALSFDPRNANTIYADLWAGRQGPWENGSWKGPNSGLYKSTDGGTTWRQLTKGLPTTREGLGRIGFCVAPTDSKRIYATVDAPQSGGIYLSEDAGESWKRINEQRRLWGRGDDFAEIKVDPKNKDIVYIANVCAYKSTDAGKTFTAWRGAPGGDDYHTIWINPDNTDTILLASDQGAIVTVNGGETFSSWYNQPTAQFYHVITDNQVPYNVYGGQQESGSVGISSRGNDGQITFREWHPVGVEEYGYVAPDPLNPNLIYGGKITRYNKLTGDVDRVTPPQAQELKARFLRTAPVLFDPQDPKTLYFAGNYLFKTSDGAKTWEVISPDLSREKTEVPETIGIYRTAELEFMAQRGVIYTVAPGHKGKGIIWAGTDDGLVHVTRDAGKTWTNVTPPGLTAWSKVSLIDAGRFDEATAYVAVNRIRLDDMRPHIYRTHDFGQSWTEIVNGLPTDPINCVREDPVMKGLLFCGSERAVYFSTDDGDHWNPLRLNMPATSIRDLVIHESDVVVGTHGRSFWILDDMSPLREQAKVNRMAHLFQPRDTYLFDRNANTDTPLPQEEPAGQNPPDGAILYYYLPQAAEHLVMEITDASNKLIRRFSSDDKPPAIDVNELQIPTYWIRPFQPLATTTGSHRFVWDMHGEPPSIGRRSFPISAIYQDTPPSPLGPTAAPGTYMVRLTVDGKVIEERSFRLLADPRIK